MPVTRARVDGFTTEKYTASKKRLPVEHTSMLVKLGTCFAAFAVVLFISTVNGQDSAPVYGEDGTYGSEAEEDDSLGRLKFVELPGIIDILGGDTMRLGLEYSHITLLDADTVLCIFGCANMQPVPSPVNGRVKYISNDTGEYFAVSIAADDDMEVVYTGLASSGVEIGQSVLEGDTLGLCGGHALTVQVYINGVPQEPAQLFGIEGSM